MQWNTTFAVELATAHFCTTETTRGLNTNTLCTAAQRSLHSLAHCATESNTSVELLGDSLSDELGIHVWVLNLKDVQLDLLAGHLLEVSANNFGLLATTSDN